MRVLVLPLFIFSMLLFSCANNDSEGGVTEIAIDQAERVLSAETNFDLARPSSIRIADNGFYLYDFGLQKILYFDKEGNQQLQFGQEGQGPGEFQGLAGFWLFDDEITLFDQRGAKFLYYSRSGDFIREESIEQENFAPGLTMTSRDQFYIPLNGNDGVLAKYVDKSSGRSFTFGQPEHETEDFDAGLIRQSIERGTLPSYMLNRVSIAANQEQVFLFHIATGKLQAYGHDGNLEAETVLNMPVFEKIKGEFFEHSKSALEQGFFILFSYINSMIATENGVALLLNAPAEFPVTVLHLDNSLQNQTVVTYSAETMERPSMFDINEEKGSIWFVNPGTAEVFQSLWSL